MKPVFFHSTATISMELQKIVDSITCSLHLSENTGLIQVYTLYSVTAVESKYGHILNIYVRLQLLKFPCLWKYDMQLSLLKMVLRSDLGRSPRPVLALIDRSSS